jgi:Predicted esterase of the alpha-beta hydrolase superfamily
MLFGKEFHYDEKQEVINLKIGLVFSGGGCLGAYEIGVWKAIKELDIDIYVQGVAGTSIGALNAVLFALKDYKLAENIWLDLTKEKLLPIDNLNLLAKGIEAFLGNKNLDFIKKHLPGLLGQGNVSRQGLMEIMNSLDVLKALSPSMPIYAACSALPGVDAKYFKLNDYDVETVNKILCATSAIPPVYGCEEIENVKYIDGGLSDNLPVRPLYEDGFNLILAVNVDKNYKLDISSFPACKIIYIAPDFDERVSLSTILDFSKESISAHIRNGYEDTMNLLVPVFELYNFKLKKYAGGLVVNTGKNVINNILSVFRGKTKS